MQQFWYRNAAEYDAHVRQMTAAGWGMLKWWINPDDTMSATWEPRRDGYVPPPMLSRPQETIFRIYDNAPLFHMDAERMRQQGWQVESIATANMGRSLGGMLALGVLAPKRMQYTVIYRR